MTRREKAGMAKDLAKLDTTAKRYRDQLGRLQNLLEQSMARSRQRDLTEAMLTGSPNRSTTSATAMTSGAPSAAASPASKSTPFSPGFRPSTSTAANITTPLSSEDLKPQAVPEPNLETLVEPANPRTESASKLPVAEATNVAAAVALRLPRKNSGLRPVSYVCWGPSKVPGLKFFFRTLYV